MIRITFELYPNEGKIDPKIHYYGYKFRGVLMEWLNEINPELIIKLHSYSDIRPYSMNYVVNKTISKIILIIVSINDDLGILLKEDLLIKEKVKIKINQWDYIILKVKFERINLQQISEGAKPVKTFNINFVSPVYFNTRMGDYPVRFPIPSLLFGNLVNLWNSVSNENLVLNRENFLNWVNAHVYASSYKMKSVKREIGKLNSVVGGLGRVSYKITKMNRIYYEHYLDDLKKQDNIELINIDYSTNCCWLEILCKFGEWTNVGANRTAGLGVMRYYPSKYISKSELIEI